MSVRFRYPMKSNPLLSFICPWCKERNYRSAAGEHACEHCSALIVTEDPLFADDDLRVRYSQRAPK